MMDATQWALKAVEYAEYIATLESELEDAKKQRDNAVKNALEGDVTKYGGYKFSSRYASGEKFVIDADMLNVAYPAIYAELKERAIRDLKVKPTKKEVMDELINIIGSDAAKEAIKLCGITLKADTQYIISKEASE